MPALKEALSLATGSSFALSMSDQPEPTQRTPPDTTAAEAKMEGRIHERRWLEPSLEPRGPASIGGTALHAGAAGYYAAGAASLQKCTEAFQVTAAGGEPRMPAMHHHKMVCESRVAPGKNKVAAGDAAAAGAGPPGMAGEADGEPHEGAAGAVGGHVD